MVAIFGRLGAGKATTNSGAARWTSVAGSDALPWVRLSARSRHHRGSVRSPGSDLARNCGQPHPLGADLRTHVAAGRSTADIRRFINVGGRARPVDATTVPLAHLVAAVPAHDAVVAVTDSSSGQYVRGGPHRDRDGPTSARGCAEGVERARSAERQIDGGRGPCHSGGGSDASQPHRTLAGERWIATG